MVQNVNVLFLKVHHFCLQLKVMIIIIICIYTERERERECKASDIHLIVWQIGSKAYLCVDVSSVMSFCLI